MSIFDDEESEFERFTREKELELEKSRENDRIELEKAEIKKKELMNYKDVNSIKQKTPDALKKHFIDRAAPMLDHMIDSALGINSMHSTNVFAQQEVWEVLKDVIKSAENPAPLIDLRGNSIEDQIDKILHKVSTGEINFTEAKEYMALVSQGFNLQKLPELLSKLNQLEDMS